MDPMPPSSSHWIAMPPPSWPWFLVGAVGALMLSAGTIGVDSTLLAVTVAMTLFFFAYLVRHVLFAVSARSVPRDTALLPDEPAVPVTVSVLVGCHQEESVVGALVEALAGLDYAPGRHEILLVDDGSTDRTYDRLVEATKPFPHMEVLRLPPGAGSGKSAALNAALQRARGEVIVIFDADHQPRPDVLRRLARHFADPGVAAVQGRCIIRNSGDGVIPAVVGLDYLSGYLVNEYGRQAIYGLPAYGGANCAVRADRLRQLGGWNERSVTEDTDLTLRLILCGERVRYDVTAIDHEEAVTSLHRYWRQRYRWARGHQQVWRDYAAAVWRSGHMSAPEKIETLMFLFSYHLPVVVAFSLPMLPLWLVLQFPTGPLVVLGGVWTLMLLGPLVEIGSALLLAGVSRRTLRRLLWYPAMFVLGALLCTKAWFDGLLGRPYSWVKTSRAGDAEGPAATGAPT
jgi:1,2-diacylglycerol 3-beta-glucosyltransferase